ncbi:hypothetical protein B0H17DRAFT_1245210 [Mycena rosella]|uniref:Uncharacterized protein n=1 Tax=Mycena rosella TaxID=1033263 RepID=A0AAD7CZ52_MYCRO|nr:hypothetical protein B0H17DRAFT_1245210 [Mycena rosella]
MSGEGLSCAGFPNAHEGFKCSPADQEYLESCTAASLWTSGTTQLPRVEHPFSHVKLGRRGARCGDIPDPIIGPISPGADRFDHNTANGSAATESRLTPALTTPLYNFDPAQPMVDASMLDLLGNFGINPFSDGIETSYSGLNTNPLWDNLGGFVSDPLTHDAGAQVDYGASFFAPDTLSGTSLDVFFDPVIYGSPTHNFGASIPAAVADDPVQAFLDSFQDGPMDLSLGCSSFNSATFSAFPSLPPPPTTPSPSPTTEPAEQRPTAARDHVVSAKKLMKQILSPRPMPERQVHASEMLKKNSQAGPRRNEFARH